MAGAPGKAKWEPRGKGGGEACGGGRKGEGRCHTPLFSLESASGGGRLKNAFLCGLRTLKAWNTLLVREDERSHGNGRRCGQCGTPG